MFLINGVSLTSSFGATTSFWKREGTSAETIPTIVYREIATIRGANFPLIPQNKVNIAIKTVTPIEIFKIGTMIKTLVYAAPNIGPFWVERSLNKEKYVPTAVVIKKEKAGFQDGFVIWVLFDLFEIILSREFQVYLRNR